MPGHRANGAPRPRDAQPPQARCGIARQPKPDARRAAASNRQPGHQAKCHNGVARLRGAQPVAHQPKPGARSACRVESAARTPGKMPKRGSTLQRRAARRAPTEACRVEACRVVNSCGCKPPAASISAAVSRLIGTASGRARRRSRPSPSARRGCPAQRCCRRRRRGCCRRAGWSRAGGR